MASNLETFKATATQGTNASAAAVSTLALGLSGGGAFKFDDVTIGVMLSPLPSHRAAYASDRFEARPLAAGEGWVFPIGAEGFCDWRGQNDFVSVSLPKANFEANKGQAAAIGHMSAGSLDALTSALVLQIH